MTDNQISIEDAAKVTARLLVLDALENTATKYWEAGNTQMQARTLNYALKTAGLPTSPAVYKDQEYFMVYADSRDIKELGDTGLWVVLIPKPDSTTSKLDALMNGMKGTVPKPVYLVGYRRADDSMDALTEVHSIMEVIEIMSKGPAPQSTRR